MKMYGLELSGSGEQRQLTFRFHEMPEISRVIEHHQLLKEGSGVWIYTNWYIQEKFILLVYM
jgi:hypothetical protein